MLERRPGQSDASGRPTFTLHQVTEKPALVVELS